MIYGWVVVVGVYCVLYLCKEDNTQGGYIGGAAPIKTIKLTSCICCRWCGGIAAERCVPFNSGSAKPEIPAWRPPASASGYTVQV